LRIYGRHVITWISSSNWRKHTLKRGTLVAVLFNLARRSKRSVLPITNHWRNLMTADEYQKLAARTECDQTRSLARISHQSMSQTKSYTKEQLQAIRLNHSLIGIANELGELCKLHQSAFYYGNPCAGPEIRTLWTEEYGDLLWYIALGLNALGVTFSEVMQENIAKLKARYPMEFKEQNALNRDLKAEHDARQEAYRFMEDQKAQREHGSVRALEQWEIEKNEAKIPRVEPRHSSEDIGDPGFIQDGHGFGHTTDPSHQIVAGFCTACACRAGTPVSFEPCPALGG
jgi:hypothetical protein